MRTRFTDLVGIEHPIIQAPMAGGATTPELVAAVSNAGGLGSLAVAPLPGEAIGPAVAQVRRLTNKPFNVNMFVLAEPNPSAAELAQALEWLAPIRAELGLPPGEAPSQFAPPWAEQFDALVATQPPVASFAFGVLSQAQVARLKAAGSIVIGTATTPAEAITWAEVGADAICAQGSEAGAHRGTFLGDFEQSLIGTMALIPQVVDAVDRPVIAAGGIMDGRGIAAALTLGADAVQMGTAFLNCPESGIPAFWKAAISAATPTSTALTRGLTGRHARGIVNEFMRRLAPVQRQVPAYPVQNALTGDIRRIAAQANRPEFFSLWAGQGVAMVRPLPAAELIARLVAETAAAFQRRSSAT